MASGVIAGGRLGTGVGGAKELAGVKGVLHGDPKIDKKIFFKIIFSIKINFMYGRL